MFLVYELNELYESIRAPVAWNEISLIRLIRRQKRFADSKDFGGLVWGLRVPR